MFKNLSRPNKLAISVLTYAVGMGVIMLLASIFIKKDALLYLGWYGIFLLFSLIGLPLAGRLFSKMGDGGFAFAKVIGIALSTIPMYLFSYANIFKFNRMFCIICLIIAFVISFLLSGGPKKIKDRLYKTPNLTAMVMGELIFAAALLLFIYFRGNHGSMVETERPMDFAFLMSMWRGDTLPPLDMWLSGHTINYYYFGQYFCTFILKAFNINPDIGYNLCMAVISAMTASLSFGVAANITHHFTQKKNSEGLNLGKRHGIFGKFSVYGTGLISTVLVTFAGNSHSFWYGNWHPGNSFVQLLGKVGVNIGDANSNSSDFHYWYPDATRFIGHNPEIRGDNTIHEYPYYSFLLGDLHAHVLNLIFVFTAIMLVFAIIVKMRSFFDESYYTELASKYKDKKFGKASVLFHRVTGTVWLELIFLGVLLGIFQMTNYWDFAIYTCFAALLFFANHLYDAAKKACNLKKVFKIILLSAVQLAVPLVVGLLLAAPYNAGFTMMASGFSLTKHQTSPYQMFIVWGVHFLIFAVLAIFLYVNGKKNTAVKPKYGLTAKLLLLTGIFSIITIIVSLINIPETSMIQATSLRSFCLYLYLCLAFTITIYSAIRNGFIKARADMFVLMMSFWGFLMIMLPEFIYVVDIYAGALRSNTMFKFTYQGFLLLGTGAAYAVTRIPIRIKKAVHSIKSTIVLWAGLIVNSVCWLSYVLFIHRTEYMDVSYKEVLTLSEKYAQWHNSICSAFWDFIHAHLYSNPNYDILFSFAIQIFLLLLLFGTFALYLQLLYKHTENNSLPQEEAISANSEASNTPFNIKKRPYLGWCVVAFVMLLSLFIPSYYPIIATKQALGGLSIEKYDKEGLDGLKFLTNYTGDANKDSDLGQYAYKDIYDAVIWLNENVEGNPITLERYGDSYTRYCIISSYTGLPTMLGWHTHEMLWRSDPKKTSYESFFEYYKTDVYEENYYNEDGESYSGAIYRILNLIRQRIDYIYNYNGSMESWDTVKGVLDRYNIEYIIVGPFEKKKYEGLNWRNLATFGTVVFPENGDSGEIVIIKVEGSNPTSLVNQ